MCVIFNISLTLEEAVTAAELASLLSRFYDLARTKKTMNGVYKTNIYCSGNGRKLLHPRLNSTLAYFSPGPYGPR